MGLTSLFSEDTFSLTSPAVLFFVIGTIMLSGTLYIRHLQARVAEQGTMLQTERQRRAALADSLEEVTTYTDSTGERAVYANTDTPTTEDTLGGPGTEGDVGRETSVEVTPDSAAAEGTARAQDTVAEPAAPADTVYVYAVDEEIGRYTVTGSLRVAYPGDQVDYDLAVQGDPFRFTLSQAEVGGIERTFIDTPQAVSVSRLESTYRPDPPSSERPWALDVFTGVRPAVGDGVVAGVTASYERDLLWGVQAYGRAGMSMAMPLTPTTNPAVMPEAEIGLRF